MSDDKTPETENKPVYDKAKIGQDDHGKTVTTAGGELFSGTVSDIADGDEHRHHPKKK